MDCERARSRSSLRPAQRSAGFALLIVLWTLVLIAFLVLHVTASGRTEIHIASNLQANAVAAAAADGGIEAAIYNVSAPRAEQQWRADGTSHLLTIGNCRVAVTVENEAARVNPNLASPALLEALLRGVGSDPGNAHNIAEAIADWVGSSSQQETPDRLKAEYQATGLDYAPPAEPVESLDELARVLGMTPQLYTALRPHLTIYGPAEPDPATPDPVVAAAFAQSQTAQAAAPIGAFEQNALTVRITAEAAGLGNARAKRTAIVRFGPALPQGYAVLAWRDTVE